MENTNSPYSTRFVYLAAAINGAILCGLFIGLAFVRNIDGDEGLYLEAVRLVGQGKSLYTDFFYQQMPLLPYFYLAWTKIFGFSLLSARIFSGLLTAAAGVYALYYIAKTSKNIFTVNVAALLLYANGIFLAWAPVIKTHPFNVFFLTVSVLLLLEWRREGGRGKGKVFLSGLLLGLGIGCRLTLAPFPMLYLLFILFSASVRPWKSAGLFLLGLALASLPSLYFLLTIPELFIRYNLFYHTKIFPGIASDQFRWGIIAKVLLEPQLLLLLIAFYVGLLLKGAKGWKEFLTSDSFFIFTVLFGYFLIHFSAATPFTQYFSTAIPLLVVGCLPVLELSLRWNPAFRALILAPLLIGYAIFASKSLRYEMYSVGTLDPVWRPANIRAAVSAVRQVVKPGETCLTWWPGYAALAGCASVPGMESHMREHAIARGIPRRRLQQYKLLSSEELLEMLEEKRYRVVVDGAYRIDTPYNEYTEYLLQENYGLRAVRGLAKIYTLKGPGDRLGEMFQESLREDAFSGSSEPAARSRKGRRR